jgi:hypothetical protein
MKRRLQGLCLLLLGALLGWLSGGEIASLTRQRPGFSGEALWVGVKLLFGLALIFTGLVFLAGGVPGWRSKGPEENAPPRP